MIILEPWAAGDFWLLEATNSPDMTRFLGGPESDGQLRLRHERYVRLTRTGPGCMYRVVHEETGETAGSVGFWEREWQDNKVYECGWGVLPAFQGKGIGVAAALAVAEHARLAGAHRYLHAFPDTEHAGSNGICRKAGFVHMGVSDFEYPKGHWKKCNDWRLDLSPSEQS